MMRIKPVTVRALTLGDGVPKICIPITAATKEELAGWAGRIAEGPCDLVEWRADFFRERDEADWIGRQLRQLRTILGERPILFTFRTKEEGGESSISPEQYRSWSVRAAEGAYGADLVDLELNRGEELLKAAAEEVHALGGKVVASFHDFEKTPEKEELLGILCRMQELGADITKAAVMPQCERDVLTLLDVSVAMKEQYADRPYITMAMGARGAVSRLCGALTGSALTFAASGRASAPGQMDAEFVRQALQVLKL